MALSPFDIKDIRFFLAVAEEENVARAAERLNVTASPLSRRILDLEQRLDLQLFRHERKRLKLTAEGRSFAEEARAFVGQADELAQKARDIKSGLARPIQIGYVPGAMFSGLLPRLIKKFKVRKPRTAFRLHPMRSKAQTNALESGTIDIAFVHTPPLNVDGALEIHKMEEDPFSLIVPKQHPIKKSPKTHQLAAEPWIAFSADHAPNFRQEFLSACREYGFEPDIQFQTPDIPSMIGLIESGLGVGVLQSKLSRICPVGLRAVPMPKFPLSVSVYALYLSGQQSGPVARFVEEVTRASAKP